MPRVSVIIPVHGHAALTRHCLETFLPDCSHEVIVVDDASTDSTPDVIAAFGSRIRSLKHDQNQGFARSCNNGAAAASGDYLVFLNNDTLPEKGWLHALLDHAERHPEAAAIGSKLLFPDNTIQHAGVVICQDRYPRHIYAGFPGDHQVVNLSRRFQVVTAACMLVRRPDFEALNGFDTAYRNGFEDVDLCLRLGEAGREVHYCASSRVIHLESVSPGRRAHDRENVTLYRERWLNKVQPDDINYYLADGLLRFNYEGRYPLILEASPLLASIEADKRIGHTEHILREQSRQIAGLLKENTELSVALERHAQESPELRYQKLREQIRIVVESSVPQGSTVLVISKGDGALVDLPNCRGWHFPQTEHGSYAGHHPANSREAIDQLEQLRQRGAEYLLIPATARWWLDYYTEFSQHLHNHFTRQSGTDESCDIYRLRQHPESQPPA